MNHFFMVYVNCYKESGFFVRKIILKEFLMKITVNNYSEPPKKDIRIICIISYLARNRIWYY